MYADVELKTDTTTNEEYLEWKKERESKTRHGDENELRRAFCPKAYAAGDKNCPVTCYKEFLSRRPEISKTPESPFFLIINQRRRPEEKLWFLNRPMGQNSIGKFMSSATKSLNLEQRGKMTNHSVQKTCIKTLLDSGISHNTVAQLSGHKSLKSLDSYAVASHSQQREMSKILSGHNNNNTCSSTFTKPSSSLKVEPFSDANVDQNTRSLFSGANIGVLNIQNLSIPTGISSTSPANESVYRKRRRYIIESDDED